MNSQIIEPTTQPLREVMGHFASGVVVVTGTGEGGPLGFTCQSFASLSLEPPLISFAPALTSRTWPLIRTRGRFCVNVLAWDQTHLSNTFARSGGEKFAGIEWSPSPSGSPVIDGGSAWIECALFAEYDGGDHTIVLGEVTALSAAADRAPLVYHRGNYRMLAPMPDPTDARAVGR